MSDRMRRASATKATSRDSMVLFVSFACSADVIGHKARPALPGEMIEVGNLFLRWLRHRSYSNTSEILIGLQEIIARAFNDLE